MMLALLAAAAALSADKPADHAAKGEALRSPHIETISPPAAKKPLTVACAADGAPQGAVAFEDYVIDDISAPASAGRFAAMAVMAPAGWTAEGGMDQRVNDRCGLTHTLRWRAVSPDGLQTISVFPDARWTVSRFPAQFNACLSRDIRDTKAYTQSVLDENGIKAAISDEGRDRPDIAAALNPAWAEDGVLPTVVAEAREFAVTIDPATDGLIIAAMNVHTPGANIPENEETAYALPTLLVTGPKGTIDRNLVEAVRASALANPHWVELLQRTYDNPGEDVVGKALKMPFPERTLGEEMEFCGAKFAMITEKGIWRRGDGRYFYIPADADE